MLTNVTRRRAHVRHVPAEVDGCRIFLRTGEKQLMGMVRNLSTHGAGVVLPQELEAGTEFMAKLTNGCQLFSIDIKMRVIHCTALAGSSYVIGCEFAAALDHDVVLALVR